MIFAGFLLKIIGITFFNTSLIFYEKIPVHVIYLWIMNCFQENRKVAKVIPGHLAACPENL